MPWFGWVVLGDCALSGLYKITQVGKSRTVTAGEAMFAVIEIGLLAWAVAVLGMRAA